MKTGSKGEEDRKRRKNSKVETEKITTEKSIRRAKEK